MDRLLQDLRYGIRILGRAPGFTLVTVLTLTLGIGANTAIFSVIDGILLSPFPYPESDRMVSIWNRYQDKDRATLSEPEFKAYQSRSTSFEAMAAIAPSEGTLTGHGDALKIQAVYATSGIFGVLGVEPHQGRFYTTEEDMPGTESVVVISHSMWQRLGARGDLIGDRILLDGAPFTVLGVMPAGIGMPHDYQFGSSTDVWVPMQFDPAEEGDWGMHGLGALGRIGSGLSIGQAQLEMDRVISQLKQEHAGSNDAIGYESFGVVLRDLPTEITGNFSVALIVLLGAVTLVLLIACANVANLLLARAEGRRREVALRTALGAGRGRLLRQLLTESLLLSLGGGLGGILLANWLVAGLVSFNPGNIPRLGEIQIDQSVLLYSVALTLATGIVFGLLPAFASSRLNLQDSLRSGNRGGLSGVSGRRLRQLITVAEVSLAVVLMVGAGLLIRSLWNMQGSDPGFRSDGLLTLEVEIPRTAYPDAETTADFFNRLNDRLQALPGVTGSGGVTGLPLASRRGDWNFYPEGRVIPEGVSSPRGDWQVVTPGYFEALGVRVLSGRTFTPNDGPEAPIGIVFNQALAQRYYADEDPVGKRVRLGGNDDNPFISVIGVVSNVRHRGLNLTPRPEWYLSHAQSHLAMGIPPRRSFAFALRSTRPEEQLTEEVKAAVAAIDADLPVTRIRSMDAIRALSLAQPRFATALLTSFALLAVALGAIGIFGVISHLVAQRSREIGIRMALGARRREIVQLVMGEGLRLTGVGLLIGGLAALGLSRVLQSQLHEVSATDPLTFVSAVALLTLVAATACFAPARRAAALDPNQVLRQD